MNTSQEASKTERENIHAIVKQLRVESERKHADPRAVERARVQNNRRRLAAGVLAVGAFAGLGYAGDRVVSALEGHMGAEQASENCVVINEPLKNRTLTSIAQENAKRLNVDPSDTTAVTMLAHEMQDFGGPGSETFGSALSAGPEKMISVELCTTTAEDIPVSVYSKDRQQ